MNCRERLLKALRGEITDRVPWIPLCSRTFFLSLPEYREKFPLKWWQGNQGLSEDLLEEELRFRVNFYTGIGADFMQWGGGGACRKETNRVKTEQRRKGNSLLVEYKTPAGVLSQEFLFSHESQTLYNKDCLLKNVHDFSVYKYIIQDSVLKPSYEKAQVFLDIIGENGIIFSSIANPPLHSWMCSVLGTEGAIFGIYDHKKELEELIELQHQKNLQYCNILAESPLKIFLHQATWGIGRISPEIYREYYSPYLKRYGEILHQEGKICLDHISGERLNPYLVLIEDLNLNGLYGLVFPGKSGDLKLSDICRRWEGRMTAMGGLDPHFLAEANTYQVKERTKRILEETKSFSNFILGTGDDVIYGTPVQNLEAVSRVIEDFYG